MNYRQLFFKNLAQTSPFPIAIEIEKAEGCYLFAPDGKKYLDLISGVAVSNVGHRHPFVIEKIKDQLDKYMHLMVYGELIQIPQVLLAQKLSELLPWGENTQTYFVNSGSEAIEGAIKLAKRYTGKPKLVSCKNAYHGSSNGALSLMSHETYKEKFRPLLPGISFINFGDLDDLDLINEQTAAVIIEPIQGEAGVRIASDEYFRQLSNRCKETETLIIADEVQSGFGRTGKWFAFEHFNLVPDIVVMAKGMGGGMPIGAFAAPKHIMSSLSDNPILGHITTFGGHPVCAASSLATIEVIQNENLLENAIQQHQNFIQNLKHPKIREVRGKGLMLAVQLDSFEQVQQLINNCLDNGLLTDWFLFCNNALRIAPPLIISDYEVEFACSVLNKCLDN